MISIQHILFPVDFSKRSMAIAPFVRRFAQHFGSKVTLLHVVPPVTCIGMAEPVGAFINPDELRADAQRSLDSTLTENFGGMPVTRIVEMGDPAAVIVECAHGHAVDLIMMPTHGYGPFRRFLLGSVAAKVLHAAHLEEAPAQARVVPKNVLCAVDRSANTGPVTQWAAQLSRDAGASLRPIHAVPGAEAWPEQQFDTELQKALEERAREVIGKVQAGVGVEAPLCIGAGAVAHAVGKEARRYNVDPIVIGRESVAKSWAGCAPRRTRLSAMLRVQRSVSDRESES